jgi:formate dehydrogenase major subunit
MKNADSILIMGSNMAECHPVAFRWVMQAKTRATNPATIIHADPRFTRTSAMADIYAPLRAGSDIVFLGALIHHVLEQHTPLFEKVARAKDANLLSPREKFFHDYLVHFTNAATLITEEFKDTEDLGGFFSGYDKDAKTYDVSKWRYEREAPKESGAPPPAEGKETYSDLVKKLVTPAAKQDPTLQHERCVFQLLRKHYQRYTPEMVEQVCGTPRETFLKVAESVLHNAGPDRTGAICYAVGWTQHTTGVQMIRTAAVLQLLLGNVGRPGGGILALRGHATIQGCTDIPTLYHSLPGYLNAPSALRPHDNLKDYIRAETQATSYWSNFPKFIVSFLKSWFGDVATADNDYCYDYLPKSIGDHSHLPMFVDMMHGVIKGFFVMGQNPAVGGQNASFQRKALAKLDWMVVRDLYETETASFWKDSPEVKSGEMKPEDIKTEVFFLPAAAVAEMEGSFTNTHRLLQWHEKAVDPPNEARSDIWFTVHLGARLKKLYEKSKDKRDLPIQAITWDYIDAKENQEKGFEIEDEPSAEVILKEINGYVWQPGKKLYEQDKLLSSFGALKDDGTTACGGWIYTGAFTAADKDHPRGHNHAANRQGDDWVALGWGFSWPANRRLMYNRASADLNGLPWPKESRLAREYNQAAGELMHGYVYFDGEKQARRDVETESGERLRGYVYWDASKKKWVGLDVPDCVVAKPPDAKAKDSGVGVDLHDGASPFIMKGDGKGWLFVPTGLVDGPLPTHYEPYESPVQNAVYKQQNNPLALTWDVPGNAYAKVASPDYPHVLSTYRLTEHHLSGTMSRWLPWLAELQPELFCEISPEHAADIGVHNTDWVKIVTPRGAIRAKALVTRRIRPYKLKDKTVYHVGLPWHWGYKGVARGDVVNDLSALVADPNVTIHEAKVFVCNVVKG